MITQAMLGNCLSLWRQITPKMSLRPPVGLPPPPGDATPRTAPRQGTAPNSGKPSVIGIAHQTWSVTKKNT